MDLYYDFGHVFNILPTKPLIFINSKLIQIHLTNHPLNELK